MVKSKLCYQVPLILSSLLILLLVLDGFPKPPTTTKKTKISEGNLERENMKFLSNSLTKFCDQGICEGFYFFRH